MNFLLYCYPRTGSTLICEAINAHPDVSCGLEVFNVKQYKYADWREKLFKECLGKNTCELIVNTEKFGIKEILFDTINFDYEKFLDNVFEKFSGFKIIANQIDIKSPIWQYFVEKNIKCIFLERDVCEACYSWQLAIETKIWHIKNKNIAPTKQIKIDKKTIDSFQQYYIDSYEYIKNKLTITQNNIVLNYSDISDWDKTCKKICEFLKIKQVMLPKIYKKINRKKFL